MKLTLSLSLLVLSIAALPAAASDRFEVSASGFTPDTVFSADANVLVSDGVAQEAFSANRSFGSRAHGAQFEVVYRPTARQRIDAQFYGVSDGQDYPFSYSRSETDSNTATTYTGTATGKARLDTRFDLYRVGYGYDAVKTDRLTVTGLVGVYGAHLDVGVSTAGTATLTDGTTSYSTDLGSSNRYAKRALAPGFGVAGEYKLNESWSLRARMQGFRTQWGSFNRDGRFFNAQASANYAITPNLTAFAGYDWFELTLEDAVDSDAAIDGTTYTVDGPVKASLRVRGPTLGARYTF